MTEKHSTKSKESKGVVAVVKNNEERAIFIRADRNKSRWTSYRDARSIPPTESKQMAAEDKDGFIPNRLPAEEPLLVES